MSEFKQTLTITLKSQGEETSSSYTKECGIGSDDMFWMWFMDVWPALGMNFVKVGIEEDNLEAPDE